MAKVNVQDIRNVAVCGHGSSGKTTLVDKLLVKTGAVNANPSVDDGTSICDFDPEEKQHKYTIEASITHLSHGGKEFNLIDTPGYPDFVGQTIGALAGVDTAIIAVNAQSGIEVNTRRVFAEAGKAGLGRFVAITKCDGDNIEFEALVNDIREMWGAQCRHCHGAKAYPGKAPKLKPRRYKPGFVYLRVTDGFRKMPPWKAVYSDEQRMQLVAYILSSEFSP